MYYCSVKQVLVIKIARMFVIEMAVLLYSVLFKSFSFGIEMNYIWFTGWVWRQVAILNTLVWSSF